MDEQEEPNDTEEKCESWPMQEVEGMMGGRSLDKQGNSKSTHTSERVEKQDKLEQ